MPKYLVQAQYTIDGLKGAVNAGFSAREQYIRQTIEAAGGSVEAFYWSWGSDDVVAIMDLPTEADAIASVLGAAVSGVSHQRTTPLLTAAQMDAAADKVKSMPAFEPPSG